jgi:UDP-2,4-diacetamido-2,4,6-trideoxy-beta-L-altropyranose hydrolase
MRLDASLEIGSGHLMRCLCLADELAKSGARVGFASRGLPAHLGELLARHGHAHLPLADRGGAAVDEAADAAETLAAWGPADWYVVDHYALGSAWERAVRHSGSRVLAIDDLERPHDCEVVLDQNFHPEPDPRYAAVTPVSCERLLGPRHALLRPEFAEARSRVAPRDGSVRRLLVFLGGMDAGDATSTVLEAVAAVDHEGLSVDVVVGAMHPRIERVRALTSALRHGTCHVQTTEMARLLADADLAVGAGGSATWERCCLGLPALGLCLADNQREVLLRGSRQGVVYFPELSPVLDPATLALHLRALLDNPGLRHVMSRAGMALVDGLGARRVAARLRAAAVAVRPATAADSDELHRWRNAAEVREVSRDPAEIAIDDHRRWFDAVLASPSRHLLVGEREGRPVGVVRFDLAAAADEAEVSIYLAPGRMGQGDGTALLRAAQAWLRRERPGVVCLQAQVLAGNTASQRLFERCGYGPQSTQYLKRISSS